MNLEERINELLGQLTLAEKVTLTVGGGAYTTERVTAAQPHTVVVHVLTGRVNPSGHLAETFPVRLADTPAYLHYPGEEEIGSRCR